MEQNSRRSLLQTEILLQLAERPAKTITELAERVDALRPSVSRSLRGLKEQRLVHRDQEGWRLTEAGEVDADAARSAVVDMSSKAQTVARRTGDVLNRLGSLGSATDFSAMSNAFAVPNIAEIIRSQQPAQFKFPEFPTFQIPEPPTYKMPDLAKVNLVGSRTVADILASYNSMSASAWAPYERLSFLKDYQSPDYLKLMEIPDTVGLLGNAIKPLLDAQDLNRALLGDLASSRHLFGLEEVSRQSNLFLASAVDNVLAIRAADAAWFGAQLQGIHTQIDFSWISAQLDGVHEAFGQVFHRHTEELWQRPQSTPAPRLIERVIAPSATVAHYTGSLRRLVEAETERDLPPLAEIGAEESGDSALDPLLYKLNPEFVEMRHGSWWVLRQRGPDRLRHAGTSQRELLRQVLELVVPGAQLPDDNQQGPQIKARVKSALGTSDSDAAFIDIQAKAVYSAYQQLNKYTHHNMKHEQSLRALLRAGEAWLRFLLVNLDLDQ
ncbi:MAG TPA: ArsR family transcriptional regulator [Herpetosiphonaceae bacterium]|nr:ArsR family transcriptional regulator [Herpetosiphonaceae bacterium]